MWPFTSLFCRVSPSACSAAGHSAGDWHKTHRESICQDATGGRGLQGKVASLGQETVPQN